MSRFRGVEDLAPDTIVRWDGGDEVVDHVERSSDRYHWLVTFVGCGPKVFPPGARFTVVGA